MSGAAPCICAADRTAAPVLAALHEAVFRPLDEQVWSAADFAALLATPGTVALLATEARHGAVRPCGFIVGRAIPEQPDILTLGVVAGQRRRGVGRALVEALLARLPTAPGRLTLEVAADNAAALRFYRDLGFMRVGCRPGYYARRTAKTRVDALLLARPIAEPERAASANR